MGMVIFDPSGEPVQITNHLVNFGWEYVWHCHILSHEEMDMMRPVVVGVTAQGAYHPGWRVLAGNGRQPASGPDLGRQLAINETGFTVQRATSTTGPWSNLAVLPANTTTYS